MIPRKSGNIINISSVAGISGVPKESPYVASKWGVIGFTETLAIEPVNSVFVLTASVLALLGLKNLRIG